MSDYKVGDRIQCWTTDEMIRKEYELVAEGVWAERVPDKKNCLEVTYVREDEEEG